MTKNETNFLTDMLRGNTDSLLLYLIDEQGSTYGYRLIKEIEKRSRGFFRFKEGTVYPALHKLEHDGFIQGEWQQLPNGQPRRCYRITEKGKESLGKRMAVWQGFINAVNLILKPVKT